MMKATKSIQSIIPNFNSRVFIIAEIGINHEGNFQRCKDLIDQAANSGADAIKIQTMNPDLNYCEKSQSFKIFKNSELTKSETIEIFKYCKKKQIKIFSTVGDKQTLKWIADQNPFAYKISSGLLNNTPLIEEIFKFKEPVFLSTGLADNKDLDILYSLIKKYKKKNISILHCVSMYPTNHNNLGLNIISNLKEKFQCPIGYSDHTIDQNIPIFAVMAGAEVIEKHFTFDNKRTGFDHQISFTESQFKKMVKKIRKYECLLKPKNLNDIKKKQRSIFSRCIVAKKNIKKNEMLSEKNLIVKRPNSQENRGAEPIHLNYIIGKKINKNIDKDSPIKLKDVF